MSDQVYLTLNTKKLRSQRIIVAFEMWIVQKDDKITVIIIQKELIKKIEYRMRNQRF